MQELWFVLTYKDGSKFQGTCDGVEVTTDMGIDLDIFGDTSISAGDQWQEIVLRPYTDPLEVKSNDRA